MPSVRCNSPEHAESELNEAYCIDLTAYIKDCKADFWIYGHSHFNQKPLIIGKTILLTNQLGMVSSNEHNHFRNAAYFGSTEIAGGEKEIHHAKIRDTR